MNVPKIAESLNYIDDDLISDAANVSPKKKHSWVKWAAMAACLCLVIAGGAVLFGRRANRTESPKSVTLGISEVILPFNKSEVGYTEEELFAAKGLYAFRGKVKKLKNITVDFNGEKEYFRVAEIRVKEVYAGELVVGEKIKMLLPYALEEKDQSTDTVYKMKKGIEGIFMPQAYSENAYIECGNMRVHLNEIASCGLKDGKYWMFLEDNGQLFYEKQAYSGAYGANDLEDIEAYVLEMLEREYSMSSPADGAVITDRPSLELEGFTEEEMFALDGIYVFRGEVVDLVNASFDLIDCSLVLGIAEVRVDRVYKGNIAPGDRLKLLLPCALGTNDSSGVVESLEIGTEGIFMPHILEAGDKIGNGTVYYLATDYADCTLGDGERWVFLKAPQGLIYDREAYPGAQGKTDLDGIEEYVLEMLK